MEGKSNPIQVADRLFGVIELLADKGTMGLNEISKELKLNKTTVHRILNSLIYMGYVFQNQHTHKYRLGFKICNISNQILNQIDIITMVRPYLSELVNQTGETAHLVQLDGINAVYIDKIESTTNTIRLVSQLGKRLSLYNSGVGKALLADMEERQVEEIWERSKIIKYTPNTVTDYKVLQKELEKIRTKGYAIDKEENEEGICCVATSLKMKDTGSCYAFSLSAPTYRMDARRMQEISVHILNTKKQIERIL
jgi:Transcriptional regulator